MGGCNDDPGGWSLESGAYPDELGEGVVDEGPAGHEETAPWTQVVEEEQLLVLGGGEREPEPEKQREREKQTKDTSAISNLHYRLLVKYQYNAKNTTKSIQSYPLNLTLLL